jgi:hypothetical protein
MASAADFIADEGDLLGTEPSRNGGEGELIGRETDSIGALP